jgi:hypothetical protein
MFVQAEAGHAQGSTTERYLHAAKTAYPDAAELAEARLFATTGEASPPETATTITRRDSYRTGSIAFRFAKRTEKSEAGAS